MVKFSLCGLGSRDPDLIKGLQSLGMRIGASLQWTVQVPAPEGQSVRLINGNKQIEVPSAWAKLIWVIQKYPFGKVSDLA